MLSPFSSPRRSRRGSKENKNPYSNQGLDKFSALLSELDEKRQSIYAKRLDPDGPPLVRFVFTSSGECVPVMIKTKKAGQKKDVQDDFKVKKKDVLDDFKFKTESKTEHEIEIKKADLETEQQQSYVVNENLKKISRPNHLFPVTVVLVLTETKRKSTAKETKRAFKRFFEHIPRTALIGMLSFFLHDKLSKYEKDPSKPFSNALAYASIGYVVFQIAHGFARAKNPTSFVFDFISILCGLASVVIAFAAIFNS
ncbi:predicted protein [Arabidopsis lyrata subsp. lyrata]|uniref:Predicted protein n=1 Tax=Arabidopsis lyrata subsp. lyrata TaxID=81972 RepID=D7KKN2_ARALL|nr:predicted protein [Arabidopsis lyrata subsp. lyrata]